LYIAGVPVDKEGAAWLVVRLEVGGADAAGAAKAIDTALQEGMRLIAVRPPQRVAILDVLDSPPYHLPLAEWQHDERWRRDRDLGSVHFFCAGHADTGRRCVPTTAAGRCAKRVAADLTAHPDAEACRRPHQKLDFRGRLDRVSAQLIPFPGLLVAGRA